MAGNINPAQFLLIKDTSYHLMIMSRSQGRTCHRGDGEAVKNGLDIYVARGQLKRNEAPLS